MTYTPGSASRQVGVNWVLTGLRNRRVCRGTDRGLSFNLSGAYLRKEAAMSKGSSGGKGSGGSKGGAKGGNPNWPSRTGNPSGGDRGNNPPSKK